MNVNKQPKTAGASKPVTHRSPELLSDMRKIIEDDIGRIIPIKKQIPKIAPIGNLPLPAILRAERIICNTGDIKIDAKQRRPIRKPKAECLSLIQLYLKGNPIT